MNWMWMLAGISFAGFLSGLIGIGGGVLFVPLLFLGCKMDMHKAIGLSLALIVITAIGGATRNLFAGTIDLRIALIGGVLAAAAGFLGAHFSLQLNTAILHKIFAVCLLVIAVRMFFQ